MWNRRKLLAACLTVPAFLFPAGPALASVSRIVFIHGRSQQGKSSKLLQEEWMGALKIGLSAAHLELPDTLDMRFPFYGDLLDKFTIDFELPLTSDINTRGDKITDELLLFQTALAEEVRLKAGVTDAEINKEFGDNPGERGPLNWEWVQAIVRAIDKHENSISKSVLEKFTRDVFLYVTKPAVRDAIDAIVAADITEEPTLIVSHSLGTVVAYSILRSDQRTLQVPHLLTIGCPLGIRTIRKELEPIAFPKNVGDWYNAYDKGDFIALNPLDKDHFGVDPPIINFDGVNNKTENQHGIIGYLDDPTIAKHLTDSLGG